jgi:hypothetical protein
VHDHVEKSEADLVKELDNDWKRWNTAKLQITEYRPTEGSFSSLMQANDLSIRRFATIGKRSMPSQRDDKRLRPWKSVSAT